MKDLLLCALLLQADVPPPEMVQELYRQAFPCSVPAQAQPVVVPAGQLNDYFVGASGVWPVLSSSELSALEASQVRTLAPGILLDDLSAQIGNRQALRRLRLAVAQGARPIAVLPQPDPRLQQDLLMAWCGLGLCPQAFYLPGGATRRLDDLLPATYLMPPWVAGVPEWPLPHRHLEMAGSTLLPLLLAEQAPRGTVAQRGMPMAGLPLESPDLRPIGWQHWGVSFRLDQGELTTGTAGTLVMGLYRFSLTLWPTLGQGHARLILWASMGFAWLSLLLMVLNLAWLGTGLWRHQRKARRKPRRQEEPHAIG